MFCVLPLRLSLSTRVGFIQGSGQFGFLPYYYFISAVSHSRKWSSLLPRHLLLHRGSKAGSPSDWRIPLHSFRISWISPTSIVVPTNSHYKPSLCIKTSWPLPPRSNVSSCCLHRSRIIISFGQISRIIGIIKVPVPSVTSCWNLEFRKIQRNKLLSFILHFPGFVVC